MRVIKCWAGGGGWSWGWFLQMAELEPVAEHPPMAPQSWPGPGQAGLRAGESRACTGGFLHAQGLRSNADPLSTSAFSPRTVSWCSGMSCRPAVLSVPLGVSAAVLQERVPALGIPGAGQAVVPA